MVHRFVGVYRWNGQGYPACVTGCWSLGVSGTGRASGTRWTRL